MFVDIGIATFVDVGEETGIASLLTVDDIGRNPGFSRDDCDGVFDGIDVASFTTRLPVLLPLLLFLLLLPGI
jgi:hypothetical protein